jgi:polyisoprenoid-binding protein YceI
MNALTLLIASSLASTWAIDPAHAQAKFTVRHMMVMDVVGTLGKVNGTLELNDKDPTRSTVDVSIEVDPQTQEAKRDTHLRSPDFFDVDRFPKATFKSKKVSKAGKNRFKVTGELTLRDVTKETTLDVQLTPEFVHPFTKQPVRAAVATGKINRLDYGLKWQVPMQNNALFVSNDVRIEVSAELTPPQARPEEAAKQETRPAEALKPDAGAAKK